MAIDFLGIWVLKKNKTGNTGTKAYFREQGTPVLLANTGTHGFVENKGTWSPTPLRGAQNCSQKSISSNIPLSNMLQYAIFLAACNATSEKHCELQVSHTA